jgi:regulator of replication initiation timing
MTSTGMADGRRADSQRRRERVLKALDAALRTGEDITISGIARAARVDRTFLYRHRDLRERVHAAATVPADQSRYLAVSRASLQADLANALERNKRLAARVRQLEQRLSESIGEAVWTESGLGAPTDLDQLQQRITTLEQELSDKQRELDERSEELAASRAANRELTRALNQGPMPAPRLE